MLIERCRRNESHPFLSLSFWTSGPSDIQLQDVRKGIGRGGRKVALHSWTPPALIRPATPPKLEHGCWEHFECRLSLHHFEMLNDLENNRMQGLHWCQPNQLDWPWLPAELQGYCPGLWCRLREKLCGLSASAIPVFTNVLHWGLSWDVQCALALFCSEAHL